MLQLGVLVESTQHTFNEDFDIKNCVLFCAVLPGKGFIKRSSGDLPQEGTFLSNVFAYDKYSR